MFEQSFGIPRSAFLSKHVIPAHEDDRFINDKRLFCWNSYHEKHPAVRILPCGHVFGQHCVSDMVKGPTGDKCPICRTQLFRPSLIQFLERYEEVLGLTVFFIMCIVILPYSLKLSKLLADDCVRLVKELLSRFRF